MPNIRLVPLVPVQEEIVYSLITPLSQIYRTTVTVEPPLERMIDTVYDYSRAQYNSTSLIRALLDRYSETQSNVILREANPPAERAWNPAFPLSSNSPSLNNPQQKILGITSVDLFVPILTYVFGEAQLDGTAGVMSTYRLDDTIYGLPQDNIKFFERTLKESVHELGHTFGLLHCKNFQCAMHASTTVDDVDLKGATLCDECIEKIGVK